MQHRFVDSVPMPGAMHKAAIAQRKTASLKKALIKMDRDLNTLLYGISKNPGVGEALLRITTLQLDFQLPKDYLDFLKENNGGEGNIGENNHLCLWKLEDLIAWNNNYNTDTYAPGYFIFASDGGGTAYAFNKNDGSIVAFQFIGMLIDDNPILLGENFKAFLVTLHQGFF